MVEEQKPIENPDESLLEKTIRAANELKAANAEHKALLDRQEAMRSLDIIGGRAAAGSAPIPPKVDTASEYAKKALRGEFNVKDRRV